MSFLCFQLALLFYVFSASDALLFSKVNCLVSSWTSWSEPNEYGQRIRTCKILRMPSGGGSPCPHIREVKNEGCNCTNWTGWSGSFGFGQDSRERTWLKGPRTTDDSVDRMSSYVCSNVLEEDVRYTGVWPSFARTAEQFTTNFVTLSVDKYDTVPDSQIAKVRDIVFILDSSGSIGLTHFNKAKADAKTLFGSLCPLNETFDIDYNNPYQHQQLAMLTYSTTIEDNFYFNTYSKTADVLQAISKARYHGHQTNTAGAFRKARDMFQTSRGARDSARVKREVLILTDGQSNTGGDAVAAAKELSKVADVYGLMIGKFSAAGMTELTDYVSTPASKHLFHLDKFESLTLLVGLLETQKSLDPFWCTGLDHDGEKA